MAADRVVSLLTDFGVESTAWLMPGMPEPEVPGPGTAASGDGGQCQDDGALPESSGPDPSMMFKNCMPLPDCDHSLHHVSWLLMVRLNLFLV